ncbi:MAG: hypothetical protein O3B91_11390 [Actinomycetota bacterium]|nr:hypothetical protein [Actinomycetota bacterium]MDA3020812.1 hypothetical protein [Actinomycetota bacterium]
MIWLYIVAAAVSVFLIAALTIGREARRLDAMAPRAVYQLEQVADFVAMSLPEATQARLTMEELEKLLVLHMNWLHSKGLLPAKAVDQRQDDTNRLVVTEESLIAYLLGESDKAGIQIIDDVDLVNVTEAHLAYFNAIGAVGPVADESL